VPSVFSVLNSEKRNTENTENHRVPQRKTAGTRESRACKPQQSKFDEDFIQ
jgi:hypothetical protein